MTNGNGHVPTRTVNLDEFAIACQTAISKEMCQPVNLQAVEDLMRNQFIVHLRTYMLGQRALKTVQWSYPADWWQAFKERFAPRWALRRWPVQYTAGGVHVDVIYPELAAKIGIPKERHFLTLGMEPGSVDWPEPEA